MDFGPMCGYTIVQDLVVSVTYVMWRRMDRRAVEKVDLSI